MATCQVCAREIKLTEKGFIYDHGYQLPDIGWKTNSCKGASYLPYEVSCERLNEVIDEMKAYILFCEEELAEFIKNPPIELDAIEKKSAWDKGTLVTYPKPEGFDNTKHPVFPKQQKYEFEYSRRRYMYEKRIKTAKENLMLMKKRLENWNKVAV
jgi:hypothetical protein